MAIYISVVFSSFIFSLLELFTSLRKEKWFKMIQFLFLVILFVLYAFNRGNTDYENYVKIFNGEMEVHDKGYIFLSDIIKNLGGTYNYIPLVTGFFLIIYFFYFYKTDYTITFIFLYFILSFIFDFNQIRNTLCSGFLLIGLLYLNKNRKIMYLIFNIIAIFFQRFGLLILLFFILNRYDLKKYKKIDNLVQIAHNDIIGENCLIISQVGIAGSTIIGNNVTLAGQVGVAGHLEIGENTMIGAQSGVPGNVEANKILSGHPLVDHREDMKIRVAMKKLPELLKRVKALEEKK